MDSITPTSNLDAKELNRAADSYDGNRANVCPDCRGLQVTDRTPPWVYRHQDICECKGKR